MAVQRTLLQDVLGLGFQYLLFINSKTWDGRCIWYGNTQQNKMVISYWFYVQPEAVRTYNWFSIVLRSIFKESWKTSFVSRIDGPVHEQIGLDGAKIVALEKGAARRFPSPVICLVDIDSIDRCQRNSTR